MSNSSVTGNVFDPRVCPLQFSRKIGIARIQSLAESEKTSERKLENRISSYVLPEVLKPSPVASDEAILVANGDLRQSANQVCWPSQAILEQMLTEAFLEEGIKLCRAHAYNPALKHGFISG